MLAAAIAASVLVVVVQTDNQIASLIARIAFPLAAFIPRRTGPSYRHLHHWTPWLSGR